MKLTKKGNLAIAFLFFALLNLVFFASAQADNSPKIISFSAQPNPALVKSQVSFVIEATDDTGLEKISLQEISGSTQDCECHGSRTCTSQTCCSNPPCFTEKFSILGTHQFCAFAKDTSGRESEKACINLTVRTVSECENIELYDSSSYVTIATKIKTRKLHKETDGFDGYPLECCPYCDDLEINLSTCEKLSGSIQSYSTVTYEHAKSEIYSKLDFPENIFSGMAEKPMVLCYAKKSDTETIFGVVDGAKYNALDFISNDEELWYWLIEKTDDNKKDKYMLSEEDVSLEKETKTYTLIDSERYSDAVNTLLLDECYHKQLESIECSFDCESPCNCPCSGATLCSRECCPECQQVLDYEECIYQKYVKLWGRPYTDYLFCYKTPLKDTAWCKQRTDISSSVMNYPWYSFGIKDKEEKTYRSLETVPQEYLNDIQQWNEMQQVMEMPDRSVIKDVTKVPEQYCDHNFESKLFRTVWVRIFTVTPYLKDERNSMRWSRTGEGVVYAGGGFRREPSCWWECCRMCAPFCNCFCSQCPFWPCCLSASFDSGVTNVMTFMMPNTGIQTSGLSVTQNALNKVTVTNGALTVISTGNIPFKITSSSFVKGASGIYRLTLVYQPSSRRTQFIVSQDITLAYDLKENAETLVVDLKESFSTSLIDYTAGCTPSDSGCTCSSTGAVKIETEETVTDSLGLSIEFDMTKIEALKDSAKSFVDLVVPEVEVGLVSFSRDVISSLDLTTDANDLYKEIDKYTPMEATCISCGVQKATNILSGFSGDKHIIIFSDGIPNVPGSEASAQAAARNAVDAAVAEGITVHTVSIGDDAILTFMEELANRGHGLFYAVNCDCPWDCIYNELSTRVKQTQPSAVVLVNDVSGSMEFRASLDCAGTGPPVVHKNILRDINASITGRIDNYGSGQFITTKGVLELDVSPDIISNVILNIGNSSLEYSSLEYPVKHELYRKDAYHGVFEPGYPYTPLTPIPEYGYLPSHKTYRMEDAYGYEARLASETGFEYPYMLQGKEICPSNCICPGYDLTDATCVDYSGESPIYYKRKDCICKETDQSYRRPLDSLKTYHSEEFYYYDFVDLYTKEKSDLKAAGQSYPQKTISENGGSLSGNITHTKKEPAALDIAFLVDTSSSFDGDWGELCDKMNSLKKELDNWGYDSQVTLYGCPIRINPNDQSSCNNEPQCGQERCSLPKEIDSCEDFLFENGNYWSSEGPYSGLNGPEFDPKIDASCESWGTAGWWVAENHKWRDGSERMMFVIGSTDPTGGSESCDTFRAGTGEDSEYGIVENFIKAANDRNINVNLLYNGIESTCKTNYGDQNRIDALEMMDMLASQTGGLLKIYKKSTNFADTVYAAIPKPRKGGFYVINFTAIQFPESLTKEDFEKASITLFIHFRNDTTTQTYPLFPARKEVTEPGTKELYINVSLREPSQIIIENITPAKYNLNPGTNILVKILLVNPRTKVSIPMRKILVRMEGYSLTQEIKTDSEGRVTFAFKLGEESTKIKFEFPGDENFVQSEASDYADVVAFRRIWWFLSPEFLLLFIVLISLAFFYRWFRSGRMNFSEAEKELKEKK